MGHQAFAVSKEIILWVLGPLSLPTVGIILAGCSQSTKDLSSAKLECSEYGTLYRMRLPFWSLLPRDALPLAARHP